MSKKGSVFAPLLIGAGIGILINLIRDGSLTGDTGSRAPRPFSNALERSILIDEISAHPKFKQMKKGSRERLQKMMEILTLNELRRLRGSFDKDDPAPKS